MLWEIFYNNSAVMIKKKILPETFKFIFNNFEVGI